jgi:hypothetical protein
MTRPRHGYAGRAGRGQPAVEYRIWQNMRQRCRNPKNTGFRNYGGRGIEVCERWDSFESFLTDMGVRPSPRHQLDRIDNDGNYTPSNCQWTIKEQNMRHTRCTRWITHNGKTQSLAAWAEEIGMSQDTLRVRLHRGKPIERVLSTIKNVRTP